MIPTPVIPSLSLVLVTTSTEHHIDKNQKLLFQQQLCYGKMLHITSFKSKKAKYNTYIQTKVFISKKQNKKYCTNWDSVAPYIFPIPKSNSISSVKKFDGNSNTREQKF